ncbi:hypothetical protein EMIT0P176_420007 [Pseudomonas sp. IT-P176]
MKRYHITVGAKTTARDGNEVE